LANLLTSFQSIYGQSVYLGNDSADYQFISVTALMLNDTLQALQFAYNNHSPVKAVAAALDYIVKLNGLSRKPASTSTVTLVISGTAGTVITNGVARDVNGNSWDLPTPITLPLSGVLVVTAVCEVLGAVSALPGNVNIIGTPTAGWTSVTNPAAASPGQPIEADSVLRARQAVSVELPSRTILQGTIAAIAAIAGVTRYNVLENPTGAVDGYGNPAHSISVVVEGGTDLDVATAIYNNRGIGPYTNGTTTVDVVDPNTGLTTAMRFLRPTYVPIYVTIGVHPLPGYTAAITTLIQQAIVNYLNSLDIGELLTVSGVEGAALSVMSNLSQPLFSVRSLLVDTVFPPVGTVDLVMLYTQVTQGTAANVTVALV